MKPRIACIFKLRSIVDQLTVCFVEERLKILTTEHHTSATSQTLLVFVQFTSNPTACNFPAYPI